VVFEIEVQALQFQLACLDLAALEHVVDQLQQRFAALPNGLGVGLLFRGQWGLHQQACHADHPVHGGT